MENIIVTGSLRRQLDRILLHEQVENGIVVNNNLNANKLDQWFETPRKVYQIKHTHPWTEERPTCQKMPQAALIIPHEVQIGET